MSLAGKKIVVTGASQGFGLAVAEALVRESADILIGARHRDTLEAALGRLSTLGRPGQEILCHTLDVAQESSASEFMSVAASRWGRLDVLINCAAVHGAKGPLDKISWSEWTEAIQINLLGTVLMCRLALPLLKKNGSGKIINLSGGGATAPRPFLSAYAASKAAVVRFTETLAEEIQPDGITANAIAPGAMNTRLLEDLLQAGPEAIGQDAYQKAKQQKSTGGSPMEAGVSLCLYLAGPESEGITGKLISAVWDPWKKMETLKDKVQGTDIYTLRRIVPKDRGLDF